jgi:hypothetical protein
MTGKKRSLDSTTSNECNSKTPCVGKRFAFAREGDYEQSSTVVVQRIESHSTHSRIGRSPNFESEIECWRLWSSVLEMERMRIGSNLEQSSAQDSRLLINQIEEIRENLDRVIRRAIWSQRAIRDKQRVWDPLNGAENNIKRCLNRMHPVWDRLSYCIESYNSGGILHFIRSLFRNVKTLEVYCKFEDSLIVLIESFDKWRGFWSPPSSARTEGKSDEPNPARYKRWMKLNAALAKNSRRSVSTNSTGYCYVNWDQVGPILRTSVYEQPMRAVGDDCLNSLSQYLAKASQCFGDVLEGKEAKRLHFIGPILVCVCSLVDDVEILVEEDLRGNIVRASGHFEFMIRKGRKLVCIVEAKKDDMEQGMAQDLVGCEVAAEVDQLDVVYGIVTTYYQWRFLRSRNDVIERDDCNISVTSNGPDLDSLRRITGKIYAILSDD